MIAAIIYKEIVLEVNFIYHKGSPIVMYYKDGTGHPGDDPEMEIQEINHNGEDIYDLLEGNIEEIEDLCWKYLEDYEGEM